MPSHSSPTVHKLVSINGVPFPPPTTTHTPQTKHQFRTNCQTLVLSPSLPGPEYHAATQDQIAEYYLQKKCGTRTHRDTHNIGLQSTEYNSVIIGCGMQPCTAVNNHWTGLLDWTTGLDYWTTNLTTRFQLRSI